MTFTTPGSAVAIGPVGGPSAGGGIPAGPAPVNPWTPTNVAACAAQGGGPAIIPCPAGGPGSAAPPPPPQAGGAIVAAAAVTLQTELPHPQLQVQPGYAVTGLKAFLQITTPTGLPFTFAGFRNTVFMTCSWDHFDVNWGDGTDDPNVTSTGGPWPDGNVTHVYQQASPRDDLHVTEFWVCPWRDQLGGAGILRLQTASDLPLEIREIQVVETSG